MTARRGSRSHRFSVKERDTRDPHFLVFKDRLFVYTGTWWSGTTTLQREEYDMNRHLGFAVVLGRWREMERADDAMEGTFGLYIWRAATHFGGKAYLCGRRKAEATTSGPKARRSLIQSHHARKR
jgi:hypothetical protein